MIDPMIHNTDQYDILIVDDNPETLALLGHILDERGYRVRPAPNGRHALKSVAARLPDLILLDVKMPGMDGYEVCRRLKSKEKSRHVPVIFISAYGETAKKVEGFQVGGVDYISKPFDREEVLARVGAHLRLRDLSERLEQEVKQRTVELVLTNQQLRQQIAERQRVEDVLSWEAQVNQAAAELSRKLLSPASVDDISYLILEHAKRLTNSAFGFVGHIDPETNYLVCPTLSRDIWEECQVAGKDIIFKKFTGLWGWVLKNRKPLLTNTPLDDPRSTGTPPGHVPIHRFLSAPALIGETLVGQVSVANANNDYAIRELEVIERFANLYAIAVQRQRAEDELARYRDHLEELVQERTAALEASNKELEGFTYSVSHDLRAPLRHIDGFMELLQKKTGNNLDEQSRHYIDAISNSARKMGLLIDDLLSFSRMGRHTKSLQQVALANLVRDIIREVAPDTAGRTIDWRVDNLPVVEGDAAMLRMVLVNLISNALKFTRPREQAEIEIGSLPNQNSETVIFVRDNGVGFDMEYADKLFGIFQRLHRADEFEGTGIGLASVRRIIARHGGRTWAIGEMDQGATFYFSLPLAERCGSSTAPKSIGGDQDSGKEGSPMECGSSE
jgi:signal transduction histidine kinase/DNA-binding response OmpR family regulator